MRVLVLRSFSAYVDGQFYPFADGEIYEIDEPDLTTDWTRAGFIKKLEDPSADAGVEKAIQKAPENSAGKPRSRKTTTTKRTAKARRTKGKEDETKPGDSSSS